MVTFFINLWRECGGISSVEYTLLLAFVAGGLILAAENLSNAVQSELNDTATCIEDEDPSATVCQ